MECRFARLFSFRATHGYFAGTDLRFVEWFPTPATVVALAAHRLVFRPEANGGVVLGETDPESPAGTPRIELADNLGLTFGARAVHPAFLGATEPPPAALHSFLLSNRTGALVDDIGRPHAGATIAESDQVRLIRPRTKLSFAGLMTSSILHIRDANGTVVAQQTVHPIDGDGEVSVDLRPWAPGLFTVQLDDAPAERVYVDDGLYEARPAAILDLVMRPAGGGGFAILEAGGLPVAGGRILQADWSGRATIWRYAVVPRSDPAIDPAHLRIRHEPAAGAPFEFGAAGTHELPGSPAPAILFDSTLPIALRAVPHRGLRVERLDPDGGGFVPALDDLPNPPATSLSLASTPDRPVSEAFVHL